MTTELVPCSRYRSFPWPSRRDATATLINSVRMRATGSTRTAWLAATAPPPVAPAPKPPDIPPLAPAVPPADGRQVNVSSQLGSEHPPPVAAAPPSISAKPKSPAKSRCGRFFEAMWFPIERRPSRRRRRSVVKSRAVIWHTEAASASCPNELRELSFCCRKAAAATFTEVPLKPLANARTSARARD